MRKFYSAFAIMVTGMLIALGYHGWQGWMLGHDYPYNTFLYAPQQRFSDLYVTYIQAKTGASYGDLHGVYLPFSYVSLRPLSCLPGLSDHGVCVAFISTWALGLILLLAYALLQLFPNRLQALSVSFLLLSVSYPVLYGLDRGNLEMLIVFLVGLALAQFQRQRFGWGVACLVPAICFKLYPAIVLVLLVRRRQLFWIPTAAIAFVGITLVSFLMINGRLADNWHDWQDNVKRVKDLYTVTSASMALSSTPWNLFKVTAVSGALFVQPSLGPDAIVHVIKTAAAIYQGLVLISLVALVAYTLFVEREFFRRAILLLIGLVLSSVTAADYHLVYVVVALVVLILLPSKRRGDLLATGLLALVCIPKREVLLPFLGATDVDVVDFGNIGVLVNPVCLVFALFVLLCNGWAVRVPAWGRRRLAGLVNPRHWPLQRLEKRLS